MCVSSVVLNCGLFINIEGALRRAASLKIRSLQYWTVQILRLSEDVSTRVRLSALHRDKHRPVVKGEFDTFTVRYVLRGSASSEVIVIKRNRAGALEELP